MKIQEVLTESVKQRLDPKCWKGKHKEGTKIKGGVRVNNCVPNESVEEAANPKQQAAIAIAMKNKGQKPKNEGHDPNEYDMEGDFVKNQIHTIVRVMTHLEKHIDDNQNLPEWVEMKISQAQGMLVGVMDYMISQEERDEEMATGEEGIHEMFDMIEEMVESWAQHHGVDSETIWEDLTEVDDHELLSEAEAWQTSKGKNKNGGLNKKGVASYRRSHPGSKLQTAVTTKPSKLKKGSKAAKRRKSFCARMRGMKKHRTGAKTARDPNSRINKSLRKWNC